MLTFLSLKKIANYILSPMHLKSIAFSSLETTFCNEKLYFLGLKDNHRSLLD